MIHVDLPARVRREITLLVVRLGALGLLLGALAYLYWIGAPA